MVTASVGTMRRGLAAPWARLATQPPLVGGLVVGGAAIKAARAGVFIAPALASWRAFSSCSWSMDSAMAAPLDRRPVSPYRPRSTPFTSSSERA
eukprot:scaffold521_cov308-Prasinococcus_capsulatus_cf.AAC.3